MAVKSALSVFQAVFYRSDDGRRGALAYLDRAEMVYDRSYELYQYQLAIRPIRPLYATLPAKDFDTIQFLAVREWWLGGNEVRSKVRSRQFVNKLMKRLVRIIKWAVAAKMMPVANYGATSCVDHLRVGRTQAPESEPIKPVAVELVEATLKHLTKVGRRYCSADLHRTSSSRNQLRPVAR